MPIPNEFKDTLDNHVNIFNDSFDTEVLFEIKWICISSNNILGLGEREKDLDKKKNFLKNRSQRH